MKEKMKLLRVRSHYPNGIQYISDKVFRMDAVSHRNPNHQVYRLADDRELFNSPMVIKNVNRFHTNEQYQDDGVIRWSSRQLWSLRESC